MFKRFRFEDEAQGDGASGGTGGVTPPESYTFAPIKGADGVETPHDAEVVTSVTEFAKANKLTQEQANIALQHELHVRSQTKTPETYTFAKVKVGDQEVEVDAAIQAEVSAQAKSLGLNQKQAQALLDNELKLRADAAKSTVEQVQNLQKSWRETLQKDPEFGPKFDENKGIAHKALAKFFPDLAKDANNIAFLDHPGVLKGLYSIGKLLSADGDFVGAGGASKDERTPAQRLFPNMN